MLWLIDGLAIVCLLLSWGVAFSVYHRLPNRIPIHFGLDGAPDGWGSKKTIFLLPTIQIVTLLIHFSVVYFSSKKPLPVAMLMPFHVLMLEVGALFTYLTWCIGATALKRIEGLGKGFLVVVLLLSALTTAWLLIGLTPR